MIDGVKWGYGLGGNMEYDPIIKRDTYKKLKTPDKAKLSTIPTYPNYHFFQSTPWKIDMEPTNDPFGKEKLSEPNLHGIMCKMLIFTCIMFQQLVIHRSPKLHQGALSRVSSRSTSNRLQAWRMEGEFHPHLELKFGAGWLMQWT